MLQVVAGPLLLGGHQGVRPGLGTTDPQAVLPSVQVEGTRTLPDAQEGQTESRPRLLRWYVEGVPTCHAVFSFSMLRNCAPSLEAFKENKWPTCVWNSQNTRTVPERDEEPWGIAKRNLFGTKALMSSNTGTHVGLQVSTTTRGWRCAWR